GSLGQTHGVIVNGEVRTDRDLHTEVSPIDSEIVIGHYAQGTTDDVDEAVAAARAFQPEWEAWGWERRRDLMLRAADSMEERIYHISARLAFEIGKNPLESLGDGARTVEVFRHYAKMITQHERFLYCSGRQYG